MAKVKLDLRNLNIPEKVQKERQIVTAMTGNSDFSTPSPTLAVVTTATDELETAFNEAQQARDMARTKTEIQSQKEAAFDLLATQLGNYVENASGGDAAKINSAGMDVRDKAVAVGKLSQVQALSATQGDKDGEIDLQWDNVKGANSYVIQQSPDPITANSWMHAATATKSTQTISGLLSGEKYWFRVSAVGAAGEGPWSDPANKIVP